MFQGQSKFFFGLNWTNFLDLFARFQSFWTKGAFLALSGHWLSRPGHQDCTLPFLGSANPELRSRSWPDSGRISRPGRDESRSWRPGSLFLPFSSFLAVHITSRGPDRDQLGTNVLIGTLAYPDRDMIPASIGNRIFDPLTPQYSLGTIFKSPFLSKFKIWTCLLTLIHCLYILLLSLGFPYL